MTLATQTAAPDTSLTSQEAEAVRDAIRTVLYSSSVLGTEWAVDDVSTTGIARRIVSMAYPLFENEGEEDNPDTTEFLFYGNPKVTRDDFLDALVIAGLPRMVAIMTEIESHIAASAHARGLTDLGWPLAPYRGTPAGLRADGSIIHPVFTEGAARARYLEVLGHVTCRPGFKDDLREQLVLKMMPSEIGRKTLAWFTPLLEQELV